MIVEILLRSVVAMLLGGAIGIEREYRSKEAGFRTHFLVALGSALFCIVSQYGFNIDLKDSSRVAAQVVSGIGFLGAGTIIFPEERRARLDHGCRTLGHSRHRLGLRQRNVCRRPDSDRLGHRGP